MKITNRQHNAILAGLRLLQEAKEINSLSYERVRGIESNLGSETPLSVQEIDELCLHANIYKADSEFPEIARGPIEGTSALVESNQSEPIPRVFVTIQEGAVQSVHTSQAVDVTIFDEDKIKQEGVTENERSYVWAMAVAGLEPILHPFFTTRESIDDDSLPF